MSVNVNLLARFAQGIAPERERSRKGSGQATGVPPAARQVSGAADVSEPVQVLQRRDTGHARGFWRQLRLSSSVSSRGEGAPAVQQVDVVLWSLVTLAAATRLWNIGQPRYTV